MGKQIRPAPRRAGTTEAKRARLVRVMMEIAALDRGEYRRLRAELWAAVERSHGRKADAQLRAWMASAS